MTKTGQDSDLGGGRYRIDVVAVDPGIQSRGFGQQMVAQVIKLSRDDPRSIAVCLSTESPAID